jgi:hypothetical protein
LLVGLQSITASNTFNETQSLLTNGILTLIDSTVPHIWLPKEVCDRFENAFHLVYDVSTDLYRVNDTTRQQLLQLNPTISFQIGNEVNGGKATEIILPYRAFDLTASHPIYANQTTYFPIRRAKSDATYLLGRTFLQEAYIVVDFESKNFTVAQAVFSDQLDSADVVAIDHTPSTALNGTSTHHRLSRGTIAGISVGSSLFVLLLGCLLCWLWLKNRKKPAEKSQISEESVGDSRAYRKEAQIEMAMSSEINEMPLSATMPMSSEIQELPTSFEVHEAEEQTKAQTYELHAPNAVHEIGESRSQKNISG